MSFWYRRNQSKQVTITWNINIKALSPGSLTDVASLISHSRLFQCSISEEIFPYIPADSSQPSVLVMEFKILPFRAFLLSETFNFPYFYTFLCQKMCKKVLNIQKDFSPLSLHRKFNQRHFWDPWNLLNTNELELLMIHVLYNNTCLGTRCT